MKQYDLVLTNRWKATGFALASMVVIIAAMGLVGTAFVWYAPVGYVTGALFVVALWVLPERIGKKVAYDLAVATIDDTGLMVYNESTGTTRRIEFADMASYSASYASGLTFRPHDGTPLDLHLNYKMHPQGLGPLMALQQHFQWAVADYQQRHPGQPPIVELGFFARPLATVVLGLFAALAAWLGWRAFRPFATEGAWGGFLFGGLMFTIYGLTWWHHRRRSE